MKKLIELLNKYEIEKEKSEGNNTYFRWDKGEDGIARYDYLDMYEGNNLLDDSAIPYIISKQFGFIERLVKNDKTNEYMITEIMINSQRRYTGKDKTTAQRVDENYSDLLLMLLAISDNPIEFLISILR